MLTLFAFSCLPSCPFTTLLPCYRSTRCPFSTLIMLAVSCLPATRLPLVYLSTFLPGELNMLTLFVFVQLTSLPVHRPFTFLPFYPFPFWQVYNVSLFLSTGLSIHHPFTFLPFYPLTLTCWLGLLFLVHPLARSPPCYLSSFPPFALLTRL